MKKLTIFVILGLLLFLAGAGWFYYQYMLTPDSVYANRPPVTFVIQNGESLKAIALRLQQQGLIRNTTAFMLLVYQQKLATQIQAGSFQLKYNLPAKIIAQTLTKGLTDVWITIPEGWRREEIAQRFKSLLPSFDAQQFNQLTQTKEGYLFPDTYLVPQDTTPQTALNILLANFNQKYTTDLEKAAMQKNLSQNQVLIIASIVEREAQKDIDRPIIAGIIIKRFEAGWPLQTDATIQYAKATGSPSWWPPVNATDLKTIQSPYNTYLNIGLPPGPICNPGLASIKAAIYPQESSYWFYLNDNLGQIHYAATDQEHQANIQKYLN